MSSPFDDLNSDEVLNAALEDEPLDEVLEEEEEVPEEVEETEEVEVPEEEAEPAPAPTPVIDEEKLGAALARGLREAAPKPEQKPLTQEEIEAKLNIYRPKQETVDRLMEGGEQAMTALAEIVAGIRKENSTILRATVDHAVAQVHAQYAPLEQQRATQESNQLTNLLVKEFPELKPVAANIPVYLKVAQERGFKPIPNDPAGSRKLFVTTIRKAGLIPASPARTQKDPKAAVIPSGNSGGAGKKAPKKETDSVPAMFGF